MKRRAPIVAAIAALAASCARDPQDQALRFAASGDAFAARGEDAAAVLEYRNAVRALPAWKEGYDKLGDALDRLGRTADARRAYAEALTIVDGKALPKDEAGLRAIVDRRPNLAPARIALAEVLLEREDMAGAEDQLRAATAAEPGNELANRGLAALYLSAGRTDEAERCLTIAAAQEPQRYRSRLALADFLLAERRYVDARVWLQQAAGDRRLDQPVKLRLAAIDYEEGRTSAAEEAVAAVLETTPSAVGLTLQAQFRFRDGNLPDALASARQALDLDPQLAAAQDLVYEIRRLRPWGDPSP